MTSQHVEGRQMLAERCSYPFVFYSRRWRGRYFPEFKCFIKTSMPHNEEMDTIRRFYRHPWNAAAQKSRNGPPRPGLSGFARILVEYESLRTELCTYFSLCLGIHYMFRLANGMCPVLDD